LCEQLIELFHSTPCVGRARCCVKAAAMEATATVAVMEEPMELAASVVGGDLHVPPLQPLADSGESLAVAAVAPAPAAEASADGIQAYSFKSFATGLGLGRFVAALEAADLLGNYVDTCESPLTLFAPSDEAFSRLGDLPIDLQVQRRAPPAGANGRRAIPPLLHPYSSLLFSFLLSNSPTLFLPRPNHRCEQRGDSP